jgi:large subunit ribosomal protein L54
VESDPEKLATYVCGLNIYKTGGEEVKIKPDAEYPEWLFTLSVDQGPSLNEMDPDTLEYWARKRRVALRHKSKLMKNRFPEPFIPDKVKNLRLA